MTLRALIVPDILLSAERDKAYRAGEEGRAIRRFKSDADFVRDVLIAIDQQQRPIAIGAMGGHRNRRAGFPGR